MKRVKTISVIILLTILAGCGGRSKQSTDSSGTVNVVANYAEKEPMTQDAMDREENSLATDDALLSQSLAQEIILERNYDNITIPVIDVSQDYPKKSIKFQDIADIEYIPLETSDHVLIDRSYKIFHVSDNYIVVSNSRQGDIFIFGRDGKIKYSFNHRGQGPEDYLYTNNLVFDENNKEIFVYARKATPVFLVYAEDGKYKRTIKGPLFKIDGGLEVKNFDDNYLLFYEEVPIESLVANNPYTLVSKKDGAATSLDISFQQRYTHQYAEITSRDPDGTPTGFGLRMFFMYYNNWHDGQDLIIADISCDTIFQIKDKSLTPLIRRTPSVHRTDPKVFLTSILKTEQFMLLYRIKMMPNGGDPSSYVPVTLMYDFLTKEIHETSRSTYLSSFFVNDDCPRFNTFSFKSEAAVPKNTLVFSTEAVRLRDNRDNTHGKLKDIASTIDPEDNPVLMIAKFR